MCYHNVVQNHPTSKVRVCVHFGPRPFDQRTSSNFLDEHPWTWKKHCTKAADVQNLQHKQRSFFLTTWKLIFIYLLSRNISYKHRIVLFEHFDLYFSSPNRVIMYSHVCLSICHVWGVSWDGVCVPLDGGSSWPHWCHMSWRMYTLLKIPKNVVFCKRCEYNSK